MTIFYKKEMNRNESTLHMLHIKWLWRFSMIKLFKKNNNDQSESLLNIRTIGLALRVMVFNVTFNNISVILWRSVFLVEQSRVLGENHLLNIRTIGSTRCPLTSIKI